MVMSECPAEQLNVVHALMVGDDDQRRVRRQLVLAAELDTRPHYLEAREHAKIKVVHYPLVGRVAEGQCEHLCYVKYQQHGDEQHQVQWCQ